MRGVLGTTKGLTRTIPNSRSHTLTLVLTNRIGKALSLGKTLACAVGFGGTCAKGFTDGLANRMADRLADGIGNRGRKAFTCCVGNGVCIRVRMTPSLTCTEVCHIHHGDADREVHRGHTL